MKLLQNNGRGVMVQPATVLNGDRRLNVSVVVRVTVDFFLITGRDYVAAPLPVVFDLSSSLDF